VLVGVLVLSVAGAAPAHADGAPAGSDLHVAQTLGDRELTVVIRRAEPVPGPLRVEIVTHVGTAPGTLGLRASAPGAASSQTSVLLGATPGPYAATLRIDRPGPWELAIDDGVRTARIPFIVAAQVVPPWEKATYGGFVAAGGLLLIALYTAVRAKRGWIAMVPAAGMVAALSVAVTAALLSAYTPLPPQPGNQLDPTADNITDPYSALSIVDYSRPPVNLVLGGSVPAGEPTELNLSITDGSTGRAVDDLLVHDNALVHLIVISPSGRLWHLHPIRVAAGEYQVRFTAPEPGEYAVAAEVARRGGGVQLARSSLDVEPGTSGPSPAETPAAVRTTVADAGSPSTIAARFGTTADLQPWLGMLGHMIIVGPLTSEQNLGTAVVSAPVWAHAHAMAPPTPGSAGGQPDETVAAYGPDVEFTYTFPVPGRYRLWIQAERGYSVQTTSTVIDVPANGAGP
jgi:hypothetical protein